MIKKEQLEKGGALFSHFVASKKLQELSLSPFDLTVPENITAERIQKYCISACGYSLLYATERVDEEVLDALAALAVESDAIVKMERMQSGEILNKITGYPSENRPVLHTALRAIFGDATLSNTTKKAVEEVKKELDKIEKYDTDLFEKDHFTDMIAIGIGGSDLGPQALYLALKRFARRSRRVHFVSNVDPDNMNEILSDVDLAKTLVVVISKSGTTLETLTNEECIRARFIDAGLDSKNHFIAVTGQGSPMDNQSCYFGIFYIWDYVGGRYSATSAVGGVMLSFALGFEKFKQVLQGAHDMDQHALTKDPKKNLPLLSALLGIWNRNFLGYPTVAIIPYAEALSRFPAHLQQLDMESNGKQVDKQGRVVDFKTGPVVWGEPGTNGQHSFFQLLHQGTDIIPLEFIGYQTPQWEHDIEVQGTTSQEKLVSNLFAQVLALAKGEKNTNPNRRFYGNRPNRVLLAKRLTPYAMGALLSYYEHKVAFQGFIWDINSFDQEGVELGKKLALQLIHLQAGRTSKKDNPLESAFLRELQKV